MTTLDVRARNESLPQHVITAVAAQATSWYPEFRRQPEVRLRQTQRRVSCVLHRLEISDGLTTAQVLAKVRTQGPPPGMRAATGRPELIPSLPVTAQGRAVREHEGLRRAVRAVAEASAEDDRARLKAIRPLLLLENERTVVMEFLNWPTLRSRLLRHHRAGVLRRFQGDDLRPWHAIGVWLRHYQQPIEQLPTRAASSAEVLDQLRRLADYVGARTGDTVLAKSLTRCADSVAGALPATFPLGVTHGDLAARNVLVGQDGCVAVLDPMPRWRAPVYDDLARLLISVRASGPQLASGGALFGSGLLQRIESSALEGFFGDTAVPREEVGLFQLVVLLDAWAGALAAKGSGIQRLIAGPRAQAYRRECRRLTALLDGA